MDSPNGFQFEALDAFGNWTLIFPLHLIAGSALERCSWWQLMSLPSWVVFKQIHVPHFGHAPVEQQYFCWHFLQIKQVLCFDDPRVLFLLAFSFPATFLASSDTLFKGRRRATGCTSEPSVSSLDQLMYLQPCLSEWDPCQGCQDTCTTRASVDWR